MMFERRDGCLHEDDSCRKRMLNKSPTNDSDMTDKTADKRKSANDICTCSGICLQSSWKSSEQTKVTQQEWALNEVNSVEEERPNRVRLRTVVKHLNDTERLKCNKPTSENSRLKEDYYCNHTCRAVVSQTSETLHFTKHSSSGHTIQSHRTSLHSRLLVALLFLLTIFNTSLAMDTQSFPSLENIEQLDLKSSKSLKNSQETIPDLVAFASRLFEYQVPETIFGGNILRYQANEAGLKSLPGWLHLNEMTGHFSGVPLTKDIGKFYITIDAYSMPDGDGKALPVQSQLFSIEVKAYDTSYPDSNSKPQNPFVRMDSTPGSEDKNSIDSNAENSYSTHIEECSNFPSQCMPFETPTVTNFLFLTQFEHLSSIERVNLVLVVSELLGVCGEHIFVRDIDWSNREGLLLWSQIADANFPYIYKYSTVLSFTMSCDSSWETGGKFDSDISLFERSLPICQDGLVVSDEDSDREVSIECYTWFVTRGAKLISSSEATTLESVSPSQNERHRRQSEEDGFRPGPVEIVVDPTAVDGLPSSSFFSASSSSARRSSTPTSLVTPVFSLIVPPTRVLPSSRLELTQQSLFVTRTRTTRNTTTSQLPNPSPSSSTTKPVEPVSSFVEIESLSTFVQVIVSPTPTLSSLGFSVPSIIDRLSSSASIFSPPPSLASMSSILPTMLPSPSVSESILPSQTSSLVIPESSSLPFTVSTSFDFTSLSSLTPTASVPETSSFDFAMPSLSSPSDFLMPLSTLLPTPSSTTSSTFDFIMSTPQTTSLAPFTMTTDVITPTPILSSTPVSQPISSTSVQVSSTSIDFLEPTTTSVFDFFMTTRTQPTSFLSPTPTLTPAVESTPVLSSSSIDFFMSSSMPFFVETISSVPLVTPTPSPSSLVSRLSTSSNIRLMPLPTSELTLSISIFTPDLTPSSSPVQTSFSLPMSTPIPTPTITPSPSTSSRTVDIDSFTPSFSLSRPNTFLTSPLLTPTPLTSSVDIMTSDIEFSTSMVDFFFTSSTQDVFFTIEPTPTLIETPSPTRATDSLTSAFFFSETFTTDFFFTPSTQDVVFTLQPTPSLAETPTPTTVAGTVMTSAFFISSSSVSSSMPLFFETPSSSLFFVTPTPEAFTSSSFIPTPTPSFSLESLSTFVTSSIFTTSVVTSVTSDVFFVVTTSPLLEPFSSTSIVLPIPSSSILSSLVPSPSVSTTPLQTSDFFFTSLVLTPSPTRSQVPTTTLLETSSDIFFVELTTTILIPSPTPSSSAEDFTPVLTRTSVLAPTPSFGVFPSSSMVVNSTSESIIESTTSLTFADATTSIVQPTPSVLFSFNIPSTIELIPLTTTAAIPDTSSPILLPLPSTSIPVSSVALTPSPTPSPTPISVCNLVNCNNGTCIDLTQNFTDCDEGLCVDVEQFMCECYIGWTGEFCDTDIDFCTPFPCDSNGTLDCIDGNSTYTCECALGYTGENCSIDIDECETTPCFNNATCVNDLNGMFTCMCPQGYNGTLCEIDIDPCDPNPCREDQLCVISMEKEGEFFCFDFQPTTTITSSSATSMSPSISPLPTTSLTSSRFTSAFTSLISPSPTQDVFTLSTVTSSVIPTPTPIPPTNAPPMLLNPINRLLVNEGQLFSYVIPETTFFDPEDGGTNGLILSLLDRNGESLPNTTWVQLNELSTSVVAIEGIPLKAQIISNAVTDYTFLLRAEDQSGASAYDFVTVRVFPQEDQPLNFLMVFFVGNFTVFDQNLSSKIDLVRGLSSHLTPVPNTDVIFIDSFQSGSIAVAYHNFSVSDSDCIAFKAWVSTVFDNSSYTENFVQALSPFEPTSSAIIIGPCNGTVPTVQATPPQLNPNSQSDLTLLLATIVPTVLLALLCLLVGLLALAIYRRRRTEREYLVNNYPDEEEIFLRRRPVVLPGDLDLPDRRRRPVILPDDVATARVRNLGAAPYHRPLLEEADVGGTEDSSDEEELTSPLLTLSRGERLSPIPNYDPPEYVLPPLYTYYPAGDKDERT